MYWECFWSIHMHQYFSEAIVFHNNKILMFSINWEILWGKHERQELQLCKEFTHCFIFFRRIFSDLWLFIFPFLIYLVLLRSWQRGGARCSDKDLLFLPQASHQLSCPAPLHGAENTEAALMFQLWLSLELGARTFWNTSKGLCNHCSCCPGGLGWECRKEPQKQFCGLCRLLLCCTRGHKLILYNTATALHPEHFAGWTIGRNLVYWDVVQTVEIGIVHASLQTAFREWEESGHCPKGPFSDDFASRSLVLCLLGTGAVANRCPLTFPDSSSQTSRRQGALGEDCWNRSLSWWGRWSFSLKRWEANSTERSHVHETRNSVRIPDLWDLFLRERFQPRWVEAKAQCLCVSFKHYEQGHLWLHGQLGFWSQLWVPWAVQMQK